MRKTQDDIHRDAIETMDDVEPPLFIPKDMSSKEERQAIHRLNLNTDKTLKKGQDGVGKMRDQLYSPNQFPDSMYSQTELAEHANVLAESGYESVLEDVIQPPKDNKNPSDFLLTNMLTRFAACVSALSISPKEGSSVTFDKFDTKAMGMAGDDITLDYDTDDEGDEEENAQRQIQRLTSWNTLGTCGDGSILSGHRSVANYSKGSMRIVPSTNRKASSRSLRHVKFDYPIIKSLKECPRPDPIDLPNLYFTEEELGQIEDDRESTFIADDVEVVCVSTSHSSEAEDYPSSPVSQASVLPGRDSSHLAATPRPSKSTTRPSKTFVDPNSRTARSGMDLALQTRNTGSIKPVDGGRKRQITSVRIYLRERSRERPSISRERTQNL